MPTEKAPNVIVAAMKVYRQNNFPNPDQYEAGLTDGLRLAIAFLQTCSGVPSELGIEVQGRDD